MRASELTYLVSRCSEARLPPSEYLFELDGVLRRALPSVGACLTTFDPATGLLTAAQKFGHLTDIDCHDAEWAQLEYGSAEPDPTRFASLGDAQTPVATIEATTGGDRARCPRWRDHLDPYLGLGDEMRLVARTGGRSWGGVALMRGEDDPPFSAAEQAAIASLSGVIAAGLRSALLVAAATRPAGPASGTHLVILADIDGDVIETGSSKSIVAERVLEGLVTAEGSTLLAALVARAQQPRGSDAAMVRFHLADHGWLAAHAVLLRGSTTTARATPRHVAVTVSDMAPQGLVPLLADALGVTPREREVLALVVEGRSTSAICAELGLSPYTVQDHVGAILSKAEVRTRRDLMGRLFFGFHAPREGLPVGPEGVPVALD